LEISPHIFSFCQINRNDTNRRRVEFASGHDDGQIMIWSKQQQKINESNHYSLIKTLQSFNTFVVDLISINDNGFDCLIACCEYENKIKIFKGEGEEEELEHYGVGSLIPMSNGQFASGGGIITECLNIWSPSSSSLSSSS
jgi:hypothetical protein